jgi:hypothetical protein
MDGRRFTALPLHEWLQQWGERALPALPYRPMLWELATSSETAPEFDNTVTLQELGELGVSIPAIDAELIGKYWRHLQTSGRLG